MVLLVCVGRPYHAIGLRYCVGEGGDGEGGTEERKDGDKGREIERGGLRGGREVCGLQFDGYHFFLGLVAINGLSLFK